MAVMHALPDTRYHLVGADTRPQSLDSAARHDVLTLHQHSIQDQTDRTDTLNFGRLFVGSPETKRLIEDQPYQPTDHRFSSSDTTPLLFITVFVVGCRLPSAVKEGSSRHGRKTIGWR